MQRPLAYAAHWWAIKTESGGATETFHGRGGGSSTGGCGGGGTGGAAAAGAAAAAAGAAAAAFRFGSHLEGKQDCKSIRERGREKESERAEGGRERGKEQRQQRERQAFSNILCK